MHSKFQSHGYWQFLVIAVWIPYTNVCFLPATATHACIRIYMHADQMHTSNSIVYLFFVHIEFVKGSSMQDVLLRCTQEAQSIIEECLNGYNYGQTFLTLTSHLQKIQDKRGMLERIRMDAMQGINVASICR